MAGIEKFKVKNSSAVPCPSCNSPFLNVIDVRFSKQIDLGCSATRRRRVCLECDTRFTTYEITSKNIKKIIRNRGIITPKRLRKFLADIKAVA